MRRSIVAAAALLLSSPALAGNPYVGIEAGIARVRPNDIDDTLALTTTPPAAGDPQVTKYDDVFGIHYKRGIDLDVVAGYDIGFLRLEGELAQKRFRPSRNISDDITDQFLGDLNSALNRPSAAPDPGAPGLGALTIADFQPSSGNIKVRSVMANALLDVKLFSRLNVYAGLGLGRAFARGLHDSDSTYVWQRIFGARFGIGDKMEVGVKYRNFRTDPVKLDDNATAFAGNPRQVGPSSVQTTTASVTPDMEGQFREKSLLLSLIYNLR